MRDFFLVHFPQAQKVTMSEYWLIMDLDINFQAYSQLFLHLVIALFQVVDGICKRVSIWPSDVARTVAGVSISFIEFLFPFTVLIFCYCRIIWVLTRRIKTDLMQNMTKNDNSRTYSTKDTGKDLFQSARKNTIKTLLIIGFCFIICWSQNQVSYFMYNFGFYVNFNSIYFQLGILMVFLNCTVNPFIYLIKYRDYQEALKSFIYCTGNKRDGNVHSMSVTNSTSLSRAQSVVQ